MSWTKRQIVGQAFEEIGIANYEFDLQSEDFQSALRKLDTMMAAWNSFGIRIGYPLPTTPGASDLDDDSNVPDMAIEAIILNLAIRLAPLYGKQLLKETKQTAKISFNMLVQLTNEDIEMQLPYELPAGAGQKPWRINDNPYLNQPSDPLTVGKDGIIEY